MPLTNAQALRLSNDELFRKLVENEPERHQLAAIFPFFEADGDRLTIPRVSAANFGTAAFVLANDLVADTPAVPTTPNVEFRLKLLATAFRNNTIAQRTMSAQNDQEGTQDLAGATRLLYLWWNGFFQGNETTNPEQFNGLQQLVTPAQTVTANGGAGGQPTLAEFDQMYGRVRANNGYPMYFLGNRKGFEAWKRAHYILNSVPVLYDWEEFRMPDGSTRRVPCAYHDAAKFLIDESVPSNEQPTGTATSVYAMVLGREGLFGIVPKGSRESMVRISKTQVDGRAQDYVMLTWAVGLALATEQAVAKINQIV